MQRLLFVIFMALSCLVASSLLSAANPEAGRPLVGDWYNVDYGVYPGFAVLSLSADGRASIAGLDGRRRSGDYTLRADGRLVIRMAEDGQLRALRTIIDSVPLQEGDRLQLQARQRTFFLSRAPWLKAEVEKAATRFQQARTAQAPPKRPPPKVRAESAAPAARPAQAEAETPAIRRVMIRLSGDGAGSEGCADPVLSSLRAAGWQIVDRASNADAIAEIELSGIQYERSIWVGRYYKINYRITLERARDGHLLGSTDGAERASGDGWFEACSDVADDITGEIGDLIEDAEDA